MKVRLIAGSLLAAPAVLVATATSGHAATPTGAVAFAGKITITPNVPGSANLCFDAAAGCLDGIATGVANAKPITGMAGTFGYDDKCTAVAPYAPQANGTIDVALRGLTGEVGHAEATWQRYGLVAVFTNSVAPVSGVAVVAPAPHVGSVPLCGSPIDLVITGALAFA
jgi:hypothetical protein